MMVIIQGHCQKNCSQITVRRHQSSLDAMLIMIIGTNTCLVLSADVLKWLIRRDMLFLECSCLVCLAPVHMMPVVFENGLKSAVFAPFLRNYRCCFQILPEQFGCWFAKWQNLKHSYFHILLASCRFSLPDELHTASFMTIVYY